MSNHSDKKKEIEDKILAALSPLTLLEQRVAYKYLYALGHRVDGIDAEIDKAIRDEIKSSNGTC